MNKTIIGIITDFGNDFAVASIKGVIIKQIPNAIIVDIDHFIAKFSIVSAAFVLEKVHKYFPKNTIFICVVDPGVGSKRETLCIKTKNNTFIGPNNGVFHYIIKNNPDALCYEVNEDSLSPESNTFHGRDVFTPAALAVAQNNFECLIPFNIKDAILSKTLEKEYIVAYIDSFGNLKTNINVNTHYFQPNKTINLTCNNKTYKVLFTTTFSEVSPGTLLCYKGSNQTLEIAVNLGSAQETLNAYVGNIITLPNYKER